MRREQSVVPRSFEAGRFNESPPQGGTLLHGHVTGVTWTVGWTGTAIDSCDRTHTPHSTHRSYGPDYVLVILLLVYLYGFTGSYGPHLRPGQPPRLPVWATGSYGPHYALASRSSTFYGLQGATDLTYALTSRLVYLYGLQGATDLTYALASRLVYLYGLQGATDLTYALTSRLVYLHGLRGLVTLRLVLLVRHTRTITSPPDSNRFAALKSALLDVYRRPDHHHLQELQTIPLGDMRPSILWQQMQLINIRCNTSLPTAVLLSMFLQKLPWEECLISGIPFALHIKNMRIFTIVRTATSAHYGTLHPCLVTTT
ncbi:hypothetical protein GWK47_010140 [Chionoecetes opilio]|uniref:Uncharacterized protein n=1 Tax=Chionoecetes opilio TaxID=41210 RepID=A0A8J4Y3S7_CHIOP|nr:hypothetical protein GWK47_010140 [Chionoecetes opilio]